LGEIPFFHGRSELFTHLVERDGNDLINIEYRDIAPEICQGALDAIMYLFPCPHEAVFEIFENVNLPGPFGGVPLPTTPVCIVVEIILPGTDLENSIPGYGPGKFVFEGGHFQQFTITISAL
jgi:hypothetical protein